MKTLLIAMNDFYPHYILIKLCIAAVTDGGHKY